MDNWNKKQFEYDTDKQNPDWVSYGPCYNTPICTKLHGTLFGNYIRNERTDRYNIMCSIDEHDKQHPPKNVAGGTRGHHK